MYITAEDGFLYAIEPGGVLRWKAEIGVVWSAPAIARDGRIFLIAEDRLWSLAPTGEVQWAAAVPAVDPFTVSPLIGPDGTVYVGGDDAHAIGPDGETRWTLKSPSGGIFPNPPSMSNATVYFGSSDTDVYAVSISGSSQWRYSTENTINVPAMVGDGGELYVYSGIYTSHETVHAIAADGSPLWMTSVEGPSLGTAALALGPDGMIAFGTNDGMLHAFDPTGDTRWSAPVYVLPEPMADRRVASTPTIDVAGTIYVGSADGYVRAFASSGELVWEFETGGRVSSQPAVDADGRLVFGSHDGRVYALGSP